jgi:phage N-6-adenine-methyltransferase
MTNSSELIPSKVGSGMLTSLKQDWGTPEAFIDAVEKEFRFGFDLDACAHSGNNKCFRYFTEEDDALIQNWDASYVWCNPPYRGVKNWIKKAIYETQVKKYASEVWMLIPARTDTKWFHDLVMAQASDIYFVKGRLNFDMKRNQKHVKGSSPFPSMLCRFTMLNNGTRTARCHSLDLGTKARGWSK